MNATYKAAANYISAGLSVFPVRTDGSKAPLFAGWRQYTELAPAPAELTAWFDSNFPPGIGITGGPASGNLVVFDFEQWPAFIRWGGMLTNDDRAHLSNCPVVRTPGNGAHVYCRLTEPMKGAKYARTAAGECLIETRGNGHYVVAPGSPPACHPTGHSYRFARRGWIEGDRTEPIPLEVFHSLTVYAAELNEYHRPAGHEPVRDRSGPTGSRPGDKLAYLVTWGDILEPHGWKIYRSTAGATYWSRPGKSPPGVSASTGFCKGRNGNDRLYVFSSSAAPFEAETSYTKFGAFAVLNHNGDFSAAARRLKISLDVRA